MSKPTDLDAIATQDKVTNLSGKFRGPTFGTVSRFRGTSREAIWGSKT